MPGLFSFWRRSLVVFALILSPPGFAGVNNWTNRGPEGGHVDQVVFDPLDDSLCYAVLYGMGFRSTDGGKSWSPLDSPLLIPRVLKIIPDPGLSGTVYALVEASGVVRSSDAGKTWTTLGPRDRSFDNLIVAPGNPRVLLAFSYEFLLRSTNEGLTWSEPLPLTSIYDVVAYPSSPDTLFAAAYAGLYKSTDKGASWSRIANDYFERVAVHPQNPNIILAVSLNGIIRSTDGGKTWARKISRGASPITGLVFEKAAPYAAFASIQWYEGIAKSTDEGETWKDANTGVTNFDVLSIAMAAMNNSRLLIGTGGSGIFRTDDGGKTWVASSRGLRMARIHDIDVVPGTGTLYAASSAGGVFKSTDYGKTWAERNIGLPNPLVGGIEIDKHDPSILYLLVGGRLYRSTDAGQNWQQSGDGLADDSIGFVTSDPRVPGRVFGFGGFLFVSNDYGGSWTKTVKMPQFQEAAVVSPTDERIYLPARSGLYVADGPIAVPRLVSSYLMSNIVVDPLVPNQLYGIRSTGGVHRSTDSGETWALIGLKSENISRLAVNPKDNRVLVALGEAGFFITTDGGQNWRRRADHPNPVGVFHVTTADLVVDSADRLTVLAAPGYPGGLYELTWHPSLFLPRMASTPGVGETGVALANMGEKKVTLTVTALDFDGRPMPGNGVQNPAILELDGGKQRAFAASDLFGPAATEPLLGWIRVDGANDQVTGFFSAYSPQLDILDTAPVGPQTAGELLFCDVETEDKTEIWLANPADEAAHLVIELRDRDGNVASGPVEADVPAGGVFSRSLAEIFGQGQLSGGEYVRARSDQPLTGIEFLSSPGRYAAFLSAKRKEDASRLLYSPQFAARADMDSTITVVNTEPRPGLVQLRVLGNDGEPITTEQEVPIAPLGKLTVKASEILGDGDSAGDSAGYLEIRSPWVTLTGDTRFSDLARERFSAALPLVSKGARELVLGHLVSTSDFFTGLAILNLGQQAAEVSIQIRAADGSEIAGKQERLEPGERVSRLLTEYFPEISGRPLTSGTIRIQSDQELAAYALFGSYDLKSMSAIPAEVLR